MTSPPPSPATPPVEPPDLLCPHCAYNLRGHIPPPAAAQDSALRTPDSPPPLPNRCPECGQPFDPATLAVSRLPWVHRRSLGSVRAFLRTVWVVTFRSKQLQQEAAHPLSYADAQAFRRAMILYNFLPVALLTLGGYLWTLFTSHPLNLFPSKELDPFLQYIPEPFSAAVNLAAYLLALILLSGSHTYFFHPRHLPIARQNSAVALAYYACAPWALVAPVLLTNALAILLLMVLEPANDRNVPYVLLYVLLIWGLLLVPSVLVVFLIWITPLRLLRHATDCGVARLALASVLIPLLCVLDIALALLLPALAFYAALLFYALT